ncbi:hypothetical protein [Roseisolibacter sp. H3M3-2]|uniref:hypothetical protein n=1 Tax=Roseisolibacter sp. H3M3-2 TaxID=3031323 RepID=UPI0023DBFE6C|nr:hypothetical protein [Roseisolibacter sp. H3M3-2]MDF1504060.1 hypothetical protein [Roseisolibacter sp. H3M3-2]
MTTPPRPARWIERAALAQMAAGAAVYAVAFARMRELEAGADAAAGTKVLFAGLAAHARYARWAELGFGLVALGLATAVGATLWTARVRRRAALLPTPPGTAA